jgi:hypothetical protein
MRLPTCSDQNALKFSAGDKVWCVYDGAYNAKVKPQWTTIIEVSHCGERALAIVDDKPMWLHKSYFWHEERIAMLEASQVGQRQ